MQASLFPGPSNQTDLGRELAVYKSYLDAFGLIASHLLESTDDHTLNDVLRLLLDCTGSDLCALFRGVREGEQTVIRLSSLISSKPASAEVEALKAWRVFNLDDHPEIADALQIGMVIHRNEHELPDSMRPLSQYFSAQSLLCVPLLVDGELGGFISFLSRRSKTDWMAPELRVLSVIANDIALALARRRAQKDLLANQQRLRTLVGATEDMLFEYDEQGVVVNVWSSHPALPSINLRGLSLERAFPADMAKGLRLQLKDVLKSLTPKTLQFSIPMLSGQCFFNARVQAVPGEHGDNWNIVALVRDVTHLVQEEARQKTMLETIDLLEEAILDLSVNGVLLHTTNAWANLRGIAPEAIGQDLGQSLIQWVFEEDVEKVERAFAQLASGESSSRSARFRIKHEFDDTLWVEMRLIAHCGPDGSIAAIRGVLRDVTNAYLHESRITQLALYDGLTQLPNRILLDDHLHQAVHRADRNGHKIALGFIDMDHFKQINDTFGHKAGDEVLVNLSKRLKASLRDHDTLARWGGDEFVVLIPDLNDLTPLRAIAERLRELARQGIVLEGLETKPTISIGFAIYPDDADTAEALLSAADHTMFHAKGAGRNNVQFYADLMHSKVLDREHVMLQSKLSAVIQASGLSVFFQPIVDPKCNRVVSVEALARWYDEKLGWVSPEVFVPMAEKLGVISDLGDQVLDQTLQYLRRWRNAGLMQPVAVNISRNQLFAHGFIARLMHLLERNDLVPSDLTLEVTESVALTDHSRQSKHLRELASLGFNLAIDDFGTGYSSLSQLHEMPVSALKIDVSFTSRLNTEEGRRIVQAIVQMAQGLGLSLVAEGVETIDQMDFFTSLGVNKLQGYYFSEPVAGLECEQLLRNGIIRLPALKLPYA